MTPCLCVKGEPIASPNPSSSLISPDLAKAPPLDFSNVKPEDVVVPFGKHKGKPLAQVLVDEPTYLDWMNSNCNLSGALAVAVPAMCAKYVNEIEKALEQRQSRWNNARKQFYDKD